MLMRLSRVLKNCQKPPIIDRWHVCSIANIIQVVFEHARKSESLRFPTYQKKEGKYSRKIPMYLCISK